MTTLRDEKSKPCPATCIGFLLAVLLSFPAAEAGSCSPDNPLKRMIPCNGHGECNTLYGICMYHMLDILSEDQ